MVDVADLLSRLLRTHYTFEELQERPLPEGVDPLKLESYLENTEFEVSDWYNFAPLQHDQVIFVVLLENNL